MKKIRIWPLAICFSFFSNANGSEFDFTAGVSGAFTHYTAKGDEADTSAESSFAPSLFAEYKLNRVSRIKTSFQILDFTSKGSRTELSGNVSGYQIQGQYQYQYRLTRRVKPWFGLGFSSNILEITNRHFSDEDGFVLGPTLEDQEETSFSALVSSSIDWNITRDWDIDLSAQYELPISDGLQGFNIAFGIKKLFN